MGLRLDISGRGDEAKLVWSDANSILAPYFINRGALVKAAAKTRAILTELSTHYRTTQDPDYIPFLSPLRAAGEELWNVLFYVTEGAESSARQIQELLLEVQDRDSLTIFSDAGVHIPWNFVYRGDATQNLTPDGTIADFSDFWSAFFQISTRFTKTNLLTKKTRPRSTFKVLYALHKDNYTAACRHLPPVQKAYLDRLLSYEIGSATNWPACREKWRRIEENDSILYLFGHSDGCSVKPLTLCGQDSKVRVSARGRQNVSPTISVEITGEQKLRRVIDDDRCRAAKWVRKLILQYRLYVSRISRGVCAFVSIVNDDQSSTWHFVPADQIRKTIRIKIARCKR